jgi:hypothetical protein
MLQRHDACPKLRVSGIDKKRGARDPLLDQPAIRWNRLMAEKLIDFKKLEQPICVR